ncbi:MAG: hypothetical protein M3Z25_11905, partial [Actinomycetota bacterium]|nr:hypothetical protein [Actinomycetota bacterium]
MEAFADTTRPGSGPATDYVPEAAESAPAFKQAATSGTDTPDDPHRTDPPGGVSDWLPLLTHPIGGQRFQPGVEARVADPAGPDEPPRAARSPR